MRRYFPDGGYVFVQRKINDKYMQAEHTGTHKRLSRNVDQIHLDTSDLDAIATWTIEPHGPTDAELAAPMPVPEAEKPKRGRPRLPDDKLSPRSQRRRDREEWLRAQ